MSNNKLMSLETKGLANKLLAVKNSRIAKMFKTSSAINNDMDRE